MKFDNFLIINGAGYLFLSTSLSQIY